MLHVSAPIVFLKMHIQMCDQIRGRFVNRPYVRRSA